MSKDDIDDIEHEYISLEDNLDETDYGFILDKDGHLKGIWVPVEQEDKDVPEAIVQLLKEKWGIDPNQPEYYGTIH